MAKIIQITAGEEGAVFALTDEGTVLKFIDQQKADPLASKVDIRGSVGNWTAYWKALPDVSVTAPAFVPYSMYADRNFQEDQLQPYF